MTLGISISLNINEILKIIDNLVNTLINFLNQILALKIDGIKIQIVKNTITPKLFLSDLTFTFCFACFSTMYSSMKATKKLEVKKTLKLLMDSKMENILIIKNLCKAYKKINKNSSNRKSKLNCRKRWIYFNSRKKWLWKINSF